MLDYLWDYTCHLGEYKGEQVIKKCNKIKMF